MDETRLKKQISDDLYRRRYGSNGVLRLARDLVVIEKVVDRRDERKHLRIYCGQHRLFCYQSTQPNKWNSWTPTDYDFQVLGNEIADKDMLEGTCLDSLLPFVKCESYPHGNKINLGNLITAKHFLCYEQALKLDKDIAEHIMQSIQNGEITDAERPLCEIFGVTGGQMKFLKGLPLPSKLESFGQNMRSEDFIQFFPDVKKRMFAVSFFYIRYKYISREEVFKSANTLNGIERSRNRDTISAEYADYLILRRTLRNSEQYPLNMKPFKIHEAHDSLIEELRHTFRTPTKDYSSYSPAIEKQKEEGEEFEYSDGSYMIVLPKNAEDIVKEGKILHHCVGHGGYIEQMAEGETRILFLRRVKEPDKPLITIEERDGVIRQCFGYHDTFNKNAQIRDFIIAYAKKRGLIIEATIYSPKQAS